MAKHERREVLAKGILDLHKHACIDCCCGAPATTKGDGDNDFCNACAPLAINPRPLQNVSPSAMKAILWAESVIGPAKSPGSYVTITDLYIRPLHPYGFWHLLRSRSNAVATLRCGATFPLFAETTKGKKSNTDTPTTNEAEAQKNGGICPACYDLRRNTTKQEGRRTLSVRKR